MKKLFIASSILISSWSFGSDFIVLFKQAEIAVGSLEHGEYTQLLQEYNKKSVSDLKDWLQRRKLRSAKKIKDLWLIRGATVAVPGDAAEALQKEPWIQGVYEDQKRQMIPPKSQGQVGGNLGEVGSDPLWGLERIGLSQIREEFPELTGKGIRVGILDTGIQSKHPELAGKMQKFKDFVNGLSNDYDDHGHGTHVAGTIAGKDTGIAPEAELMMGKIFGAVGGGQDSEILEAMQWQFDPDGNPKTADYPQVISNSWGADLEEGIHDIEEFLPYHLAVQTWIQGGIIPVFAAGNSGKNPNGMPGGLPDVISVGAFDSHGEIAEFSSMGPNLWKMGKIVLTVMKPDISAPGVGIGSALPGNQYAAWDGTSMATPHVTGAIALLLQANPKLNYAEVKSLILETAEKKADNQFGYGILNAYELVKAGIQKRK